MTALIAEVYFCLIKNIIKFAFNLYLFDTIFLQVILKESNGTNQAIFHQYRTNRH